MKSNDESNPNLFDILKYFGKLGLLGFGGPMALIAYMRKDLILGRKWLSPEKFDQVFTLIKMMPGPVAFMCAVFLGHNKKGFWGGLVAALSLVIPAFVLVILIASNESLIEKYPAVAAFFRGLQVASTGIIAASVYSLSTAHLKKISFWILVVTCGILFWLRWAPEPILILGFALVYLLLVNLKNRSGAMLAFFPVIDQQALENLRLLAISCFKAGAFIFGSGLAIVPMLEDDFVTRLQWMNHFEFMNALSVGQLTPGPVVITVSYIGFKKLGLIGAVTATLAIFLPSFVHMVTWFPRLLPKLSKLNWIRDFSFAAIAAVVGCLIAATIGIGISLKLSSFEALAVLVVSVLVIRYKVNAIFLVLGMGIIQLLLTILAIA